MNKGAYLCPPPDDGQEWILADDAAELMGIKVKSLREQARKFAWVRHKQPGKQMWLLKSEVMRWHNFLRDRERWYKQRRPKTWEPMVSMEPKEAEPKFPDYWWTAEQAAAFMGVSKTVIYRWTKKGIIPVFTCRKLGRGGKYWYSPTSLRGLKEDEDFQRRQAIWQKAKQTMQQSGVPRAGMKSSREKVYPTVPKEWLTVREAARRLEVSVTSVLRLRKMERFIAKQWVGDWDKKKRPWFIHEDSVEEYKNDPEYQKLRQRGLNAVTKMFGKPVETESEFVAHLPERGTPSHLTCGYTTEELRLPRERVVGVDKMW